MLGLFSMTRREGLGDETSSKSGRVRVEAKPTVEDLRPGSKRSIFRSGLEEEHLSVRTNQARACGLLVGILHKSTRRRGSVNAHTGRKNGGSPGRNEACIEQNAIAPTLCTWASVGVRAFVVLEWRSSSPTPWADRVASPRRFCSLGSHASSVLHVMTWSRWRILDLILDI